MKTKYKCRLVYYTSDVGQFTTVTGNNIACCEFYGRLGIVTIPGNEVNFLVVYYLVSVTNIKYNLNTLPERILNRRCKSK